WVFQNCLASFEAEAVNTALLDSPTKGRADPYDVLWSDGGYLASCGGTNEVLLINGWLRVKGMGWTFGYKQDLENLKKGYSYNPEDLTMSRQYVEGSLKTGPNPRRMALSGDGKTLVVANYLGESLTVIDVAKRKVIKTISLNGPPPDA